MNIISSNFEAIVFYIFAAMAVLAALRVITATNPVHAVLFLVLVFISSSGIWMLLEAEFLAISLVLVYVGAVMVLFLFVVMMLDINLVRLREGFWRWLPFGAGLAGLMAFEMIYVLGSSDTSKGMLGNHAAKHGPEYSNTKALGMQIYTDYVYPFEIAAVILLVAMISAIALTLRKRKDSRSQEVNKQISVKKADRVRIVSMKAEVKKSSELPSE